MAGSLTCLIEMWTKVKIRMSQKSRQSYFLQMKGPCGRLAPKGNLFRIDLNGIYTFSKWCRKCGYPKIFNFCFKFIIKMNCLPKRQSLFIIEGLPKGDRSGGLFSEVLIFGPVETVDIAIWKKVTTFEVFMLLVNKWTSVRIGTIEISNPWMSAWIETIELFNPWISVRIKTIEI